ncbi:MAG: hypothetical protein ABIV06_11280 [Thermoanaerobaculia bacterium]
MRRRNSAIRLAGWTLAIFVSSAVGAGQLPRLVKDLNTNLEHAYGSAPGHFLSIGDRALFFATTDAPMGYEIWSSDGTAAGTQRAAVFCRDGWNGPFADDTPLVGVVGGAAILSEYCYGEEWNQRLWRSDGTASGTWLLPVDRPIIYTGSEVTQENFPQTLAGHFLFATRASSESPLELWSTDGTAEGTAPYATLPAQPSQFVSIIAALDQSVLIGLNSLGGVDALDLWRTDGTAAGTRFVGSYPVRISYRESLSMIEGRLFLVASGAAGQELWVTDGSPAGTFLVTAFSHANSFSTFRNLRRVGNEVAFIGWTPEGGHEIWRSDGTAPGTYPLSDFGDDYPFPSYAFQPEVERVDGSYFFLGRAEDGFLSLWRNDGVPGAARRVKKVAPPEAWFPEAMWIERTDGGIVFTGFDGFGWELFASDGTAAGTFRLADTCPGECSGDPSEVVTTGDGILFTAFDENHRRQLWRTDGTAAGTRKISSELHITSSEYYSERYFESAPVRNGWIFGANDGAHGFEPWFASEDSSHLIADLKLDTAGIDIWDQRARDSDLAFSTRTDFEYGDYGVYYSDATEVGTVEVARTHSCSCGLVCSTPPPAIFASRVGFLFEDTDECQSGSLRSWNRSSGEVLRLFATDHPTRPGSFQPASVGDELFVFVSEGETSTSIWSTDGTELGTSRLLSADSRIDLVSNTSVFGGLLVTRGEPAGGNSLGVFDLESHELRILQQFSAGEYWLHPPTAVGTAIYFPIHRDNEPEEIWVSDGSLTGTRRLVELASEYSLNSSFFDLNGVAIFASSDVETGLSLWASDGTPEGTQTIATIARSNYPSEFGRIGNHAYFGVSVPQEYPAPEMAQLWESNGTTAGSRLLGELLAAGKPAWISGNWSFAGGLLLETNGPENERSLLRFDGSLAGIELLWTTPPRPDIGPYADLSTTLFGQNILFVGRTPEFGDELMISDGTAAGTRLLADIRPGAPSSRPFDLIVAGDRVYFTADDGTHGRELWTLAESSSHSCEPSSTVLCLLDGRFELSMTGGTGAAAARPLTDATGAFARGGRESPDAFVKLVDGNAINGKQWLFAADLVPEGFLLHVLDTANGRARTWTSPDGVLASFADIAAFDSFPATPDLPAPALQAPVASEGGGCIASSLQLCFVGGRIAVEASGVSFAGEAFSAQTGALDLGGNAGGFWFFDPAILELVVRVQEPMPARFSLSIASLTNLGYAVTVTDLPSGASRIVTSSPGQLLSQEIEDLFPATP